MSDESSELLTGWGRTAPTAAHVETPGKSAEVDPLLDRAGRRGLIARGLGRSYGDAAQNAGGSVIDLRGLRDVREFDVSTGRLRISAGASLDAIMRMTLPFGWFVPVTPGTRFVTVGGAIAADIHGKNHHVDGSFANHVEAFTLHTPKGVLEVSPHDEPELFWDTAGAMGLTGVVTEATLRLLPVETSLVSVDTERASDLDDLMARMRTGDAAYRYSVAWIDCTAQGAALGRGVLTRGDHAPIEALSEQQREHALRFDPRTRIMAPPWVPNGMLNRLTVRAFNEMWFRKAPRFQRGHLESIAAFFHPLDGVDGWNRLYGSRGFLQYQFVVPDTEDATLRRRGREAERRTVRVVPRGAQAVRAPQSGRALVSHPRLDARARHPDHCPRPRAAARRARRHGRRGRRPGVPGERLAAAPGPARDHVPRSRPLPRATSTDRPVQRAAIGPVTATRPDIITRLSTAKGQGMKDALGSVQSVLVLGGGSDIARATCRELVGRRGRTFVLAARRPDELDTATKELRDLGATAADAVHFDAAALDTHDAFVDEMFDRYGDFDLVLFAFGVLGDQAAADHRGSAAVDIVRSNYLGAVSVAVPIATRLEAQGHGSIVVLSSVAGERARRANFVYGSSKAGMDAFFQGLGDRLVGTGVDVMIVRPGFVHTKMTEGLEAAPLSTTPEAVAAAIVRGLERGSEMIWVPPALRYVMSVLRHVPRRIFRKLPV